MKTEAMRPGRRGGACALLVLGALGAAACKKDRAPNRDHAAARPPAATSSGRTPAGPIRMVTYNVLADPVSLDRRIPPLLEILRTSAAEIIALQEVAPWFLKRLRGQPWTKRYHFTRHGDGRILAPGGQLILSRLPILESEVHPLPGRQRRTAVLAVVRIRGQRVAFITAHMESYLQDGPIRAAQLNKIFSLANRFPAAVVLGDFNFGDGEHPETSRLDTRYVDLWQALRPDTPGYTWDMERSEMARKGAFPGEKSRRLDRILVRMKGFRPAAVKIIGRDPISGDRALFPSDHFGLIGSVR